MPKVALAEIGCPIVQLSASDAFAVCSKEGALHENHDRGAAAILPDRSTVLFACLDGHGAEGASVSGYSLRNLLAGCAAALQVSQHERRERRARMAFSREGRGVGRVWGTTTFPRGLPLPGANAIAAAAARASPNPCCCPCATYLPLLNLCPPPKKQAGKPATDAVHFAFGRTSGTMAQNVNDCRFSGSTAILTVLQNTEKGRVVTTGWVGDSRALVARTRPQQQGQQHAPPGSATAGLIPVPLTKDHKPTDPKERQRLADCRAIVRPSRVINPHTGAWIEVGAVRVWDSSQIYGVAMSRSLGDMQVHPFLIPTPEVSTRLLDDKDKLLVLATDGVWDVMENDEAVAVSSTSAPAGAAKEMVDTCAKRWDTQMPGRRDDITAVIVDLSHADLNVSPEARPTFDKGPIV